MAAFKYCPGVKRTMGILLMMTESSRCEVVVVVEKEVFLGV